MTDQEKIMMLEAQVYLLRAALQQAAPKLQFAGNNLKDELWARRCRLAEQKAIEALELTQKPEYIHLNGKDFIARIERMINYRLTQKLSSFGNKAFNGHQKEYPSNVADALSLWLSSGTIALDMNEHLQKYKAACEAVDNEDKKDEGND